MPVKIAKYRKQIKYAISQKDGKFGNGILYKMCRENPKHNDPDVVAGKVWLIGRANSAAIERLKKKININDDFYKEKVGPALTCPEIDKRLDRLQEIRSVSDDNISDILTVHKYLQDKVCEITDMDKRSLCSKYLHFHLPRLFFIYDSRAAGALQRLYPGKVKGFNDLLKRDDVDKTYAVFFLQSISFKKSN